MLFSRLLALSRLIGQEISTTQLKIKLARWVQPA